MLNRLLQICLWLLSFSATALPEQCLQLPQRTQACPHLLYKKSKLAVPALMIKQGGVICLCLSDLHKLQSTNLSALEKIDQQADWNELSRHYQLSPQEILALIRE